MREHRVRLVLLMALLIFGLFYRLYLASFAWKPVVYDAATYSNFAKEFVAGNYPIDCCLKSMGFPLIVSVIYRLFGVENYSAVHVVNIIMDLATALLLYVVGIKKFGVGIGLVAFFLYIVNPWTSSFTGLVLTENATLFMVGAILWIITQKLFREKSVWWFLFGAGLGFLVFIRLALYIFSISIIVAFAICIFRGKTRLRFLIVSACGFLLISTYSIVRNIQEFGKATITPPYTMQAQRIYWNFFWFRESEVVFFGINPSYNQIIMEYVATPLEDRPTLQKKYYSMLFARLKTEWSLYLKSIAMNIVWLWDHEHLYTYNDPFYPNDKIVLQFLNISFMLLCFIGMIVFAIRKKARVLLDPLFLFTMGMLLSITILFPLVSNESRHSLPFFGPLMVWAALGIAQMKTAVAKFLENLLHKV